MGEPDNQDELAPGTAFGKYEIVRQIGTGGFGTVYEAQVHGQRGFSKRVALKLLHRYLIESDERFVNSMVNEARIGGMLHHANIVDILEFDHVDGQHYLAMEFVDGPNLSEILQVLRERDVRLPAFAVIGLALQICRGLHHAHCQKGEGGEPLNLIHRDLKPSNIILSSTGTAKLLDFGIAKARTNLQVTTDSAPIKGTPQYMSPEQLRGDRKLTRQSDIYSLAVVLYEMLTLFPLFPAPAASVLTQMSARERTEEAIGRADQIINGMGPILQRALREQAADRYHSARALADDVRELAHVYPAQADLTEFAGRIHCAVRSRAPSDTDAPPSAARLDQQTPALAVEAPSELVSPLDEWNRFRAAFPLPANWGTPPLGTSVDGFTPVARNSPVANAEIPPALSAPAEVAPRQPVPTRPMARTPDDSITKTVERPIEVRSQLTDPAPPGLATLERRRHWKRVVLRLLGLAALVACALWFAGRRGWFTGLFG